MRRGLALIIVVGVLGVLAVLAAAFVAMAQMERRASEQRVNAARAYLLARSGIEDALARLELGQDPAYGGEDWDNSGTLNGFEAGAEVYHPGTLDVEACPVRHALRPSFFARDPSSLGADGKPAPRRLRVDGRERGYSGALSGDYALKVQNVNAGIFVNGGALDSLDRDPDGPGADGILPVKLTAADEIAPMRPNGIPDHRDTSMEGPNGFLVRLLDNLEAALDDPLPGGLRNPLEPRLGEAVVGRRPADGYGSLEELVVVLGEPRYERFRPYLTLHAWVDPQVVKPQPMDGRPRRFQDIDDPHRMGAQALEISGYRVPGSVTVQGGVTTNAGALVYLNPGTVGLGTEEIPWTQTVTAVNGCEGAVVYPLRWERGFVYAASQLRPAAPALEPRAPLSLNRSSSAALAAAFLGLKGTHLESWDGSAGWDSGFGWSRWVGFFGAELYVASGGVYPYPSPATEETPWHRTRLDYGMTYGNSPFAPPSRPWYGPSNYNPNAVVSLSGPDTKGGTMVLTPGVGGRPLIQAAPLGRLRETLPITRAQALAAAREARARISQAGPFRTWGRFNAFVEALPLWEDLNDDGILDGAPYLVHADTDSSLPLVGTVYTRRMYRGEDRDGDGVMDNQTFPGGVKGLTFPQKDVLRAMANPNTDLNDFNPDQNLFKEVDKTDLAGIVASSAGYAHTTELDLGEAGGAAIRCAGRVLGAGGRLLARREAGARVGSAGRILRHSTQEDFMKGFLDGLPLEALFEAPPQPPPGGQPLLSYPEPEALAGGARWARAAWDGQIALGFPGAQSGPDETLRGDLFGSLDAATGDPAVPDLRGPFQAALLSPSGQPDGNLFPDGVYSEKDRALKFALPGNIPDVKVKDADPDPSSSRFACYIACWVKPNWFPELSPRAHALISLSRASETATHKDGSYNRYDILYNTTPLDEISVHPVGLYFVPARNNAWEDRAGNYDHSPTSTRGGGWPRRALLWGTTHSLFMSDALNRRGMASAPPPSAPARLEGRRWQHVAVTAGAGWHQGWGSRLILGRRPSGNSGGGWNHGFGATHQAIGPFHADGAPNHLRFGEIAGEHNMNYVADATFAHVRLGWRSGAGPGEYAPFFEGPSGPAARGRYLKEDGAAYRSAPLPPGMPLRITWTGIPCDLWFDEDGDGWLDTLRNDRDGNGLRDVRIALEVWDGTGRIARFDDPAADNRIPPVSGPAFYKAVFVNEWDATTRANHPLDVTPYLDDVTILCATGDEPRIAAWDPEPED